MVNEPLAPVERHAPASEARRRLFVALAAALGVLLLGGLFWLALNLVSQQGARPRPGSPAPDFELRLFEGYRAGYPEVLRLSDLRGRVVVINFWASWCEECYKEAAALERVWREYRERGVVFVGVDYLDTEAPALAYLKQFDVTYPNGLDVQQRIAKAYRITGVPETFFIDREGRVAEAVIAPLTEADLRRRLDALLR
ncbi:MAG: TlpA family protein disulfide reductase [Thermoflexales bacterium]|nr:TlpA family protein disulfide reductase [Thermoflexales bacterium]